MKTRLFLLLAMLSVAITHADAQKIGYLNTSDLLKVMPEVKRADSLLTAFATEAQSIYDGYLREYNNLLNDYTANAKTWSDIKVETVETDLGNMQIRLNDFEAKSNDKLAARKQELYTPILDNIQAKVKEVGAEGKFTTILDASAMLYIGADCVDVMPLMKKKLGIQ